MKTLKGDTKPKVTRDKWTRDEEKLLIRIYKENKEELGAPKRSEIAKRSGWSRSGDTIKKKYNRLKK
jgi:hypothetical protein